MQISPTLNLVIPIRTDEAGNPTVYAYHTPISREVFEANYRIIAATQVALSGKGAIGIRIATLALKDAAAQDALAQGQAPPTTVPLLADIYRLTHVLAPTPGGYAPMPVNSAIAGGFIDAEEWSEAESACVFFTCALALVPKAARQTLAQSLASVMRGSITSSTPTAYAAGLATSTPAATSAETVTEVTSGTQPEVPQ